MKSYHFTRSSLAEQGARICIALDIVFTEFFGPESLSMSYKIKTCKLWPKYHKVVWKVHYQSKQQFVQGEIKIYKNENPVKTVIDNILKEKQKWLGLKDTHGTNSHHNETLLYCGIII